MAASTTTSGELAHYYRFQQLLLGRYYQDGRPARTQPTGPPLDVDWDAVYPVKTNARLADYPEGSELRAAALDVQRRLRGLPRAAHRAFNGQPGAAASTRVVRRCSACATRMTALMRNPIPGQRRRQRRADVRDGARVAAVGADDVDRPTGSSGSSLSPPTLTAFTRLELRGTGRRRTTWRRSRTSCGERSSTDLLDDLAREPTRRAGAAGPGSSDCSAATIFSDDRLGPVARNVIKLWYVGTGTRCRPSGSSRYGAPASGDDTFTVTAAAYTEGLLWPAIGGQPAGRQGARVRLLGWAAAHPRTAT